MTKDARTAFGAEIIKVHFGNNVHELCSPKYSFVRTEIFVLRWRKTIAKLDGIGRPQSTRTAH
jgi:hypothetical protein